MVTLLTSRTFSMVRLQQWAFSPQKNSTIFGHWLLVSFWFSAAVKYGALNLFHFGGFFLSSSFDPFTAVKRSNNSFSKEFLFFFLPPTRAELGFAGQLHQTDKVGERKKRIVRVKIERYVLLSVRLFFFCTVRAPFTINERLVDFFSLFFFFQTFSAFTVRKIWMAFKPPVEV